jgi:uncharacterized delta-60 repeat protein
MTIGGPDPTFGNGGVAPSPVGAQGTFEEVVEVAGGKLVAVGAFDESQFLVARYKPDGTVDLAHALPGTFSPAAAVALPDGKVLVLGQDGRLFRLTASLAPDTTFGPNGFVTTTFPAATGAVTVQGRDLALQPDGKVVAGFAWRRRFSLQFDDQAVVARYNPDGSPDTTFSGDGFAFVDFAPGTSGTDGLETLNAVAVLSDGRIALGSTTILDGQGRSWAYGILTADGNPLDTHRVAGPGTGVNSLNDIQPVPGGGFLAAGTAGYAFPRTNEADMVVARYQADGTPDTTFGTNGFALANFVPANATGEWLAVQPNGMAIVGGTFSDFASPRNEHYASARFLSNGTLDPTWGQGGRSAFAATPRSAATDMIFTSTGRLVFSGTGSAGPVLVGIVTSGRTGYRPPTRPAFVPNPRDPLGGAPALLG